jgi:hypothetical protein
MIGWFCRRFCAVICRHESVGTPLALPADSLPPTGHGLGRHSPAVTLGRSPVSGASAGCSRPGRFPDHRRVRPRWLLGKEQSCLIGFGSCTDAGEMKYRPSSGTWSSRCLLRHGSTQSYSSTMGSLGKVSNAAPRTIGFTRGQVSRIRTYPAKQTNEAAGPTLRAPYEKAAARGVSQRRLPLRRP